MACAGNDACDTSVIRMLRFLSKYQVNKGCAFTHTSLGKPAGSYFIPTEISSEVYKVYADAIEAGHDMYLTERHRHIGPIVIDLDFRYKLPENEPQPSSPVPHRYTADNIHTIVEEYASLVSKIFDVDDRKEYEIYVMEKPNASIASGNIKEGIHIIIPAVVSRPSIQYIMRNKAITALKSTFESMGCSNDANDIIDEAVIERNNWLMYGSKKPEGTSYEITYVYKVMKDGTMTYTSSVDNDLELPNTHTLVDLLSIRNKYDETKLKLEARQEARQFEEELELRRKKMETARHIIMEKANNSKNTYHNLEQVITLVDILNPARGENYNDWIRLGWCLRNIDHRLLSTWDAFSKKSPKYASGQCDSLWNRMKVGGLNIGTLHMWAKNDCPEKYAEMVRDNLKDMIFQSRSGTHNDVAQVIYHMYRYDYVCTSIKNRYWYEFREHRWHPCDGGYSLRMKISNEVWKEYLAASRDWTQKAMDSSIPQDQAMSQDHSKRMAEIAVKLKTTSFKDNLMKECSELFYNEKFEELLDSNVNLIGFENGVYDLDTFEFREGRPEDYLSYSTKNNYIPLDPNHQYVEEIKRYFSQVLPIPHVREYVLKLMATFLHGAIKDQKFYMWTGSGSNSKSLCIDFFERSFGDYCCKFPITLLTQKRAASNAATSELARAKGKRFACLQEPSEDEKLNIGLMKELSGGDKILARAIYKEPVEFKPQFKMLLLCNHLPSVPSDDGGTWRRIRVVEFTSKFVDNPVEENEFPIDMELPIKMEEWREHFIPMLIEYYRLYKQEGLHEPEEVLACTRDYKRNNDHIADFMHNCIEKKDSAFLSLNEAFAELKAWAKDDNINMKMPTKSDLEKYLSKNLTKCVCNNHFKGFKGQRLKNRYQIVESGDNLD